jgi:hypothetical protein
MYILSSVMRFSVALPMDFFPKSIYIVRPIGHMGRIMRRMVRDLKRNHVLLAFNIRNVESLFYLTIISCHLTPLLHRSCGLSAEWAALVRQPSR